MTEVLNTLMVASLLGGIFCKVSQEVEPIRKY
uniref:Uncharacterized protein n=1 Tax=Anguilla anguilla TaxID=7936 RepID=A0A0E9SCN1_ANGAN